MTIIEDPIQKQDIREGGKILGRILSLVANEARPGLDTGRLNEFANDLIDKSGVKPAFLNYDGYPATLCTSINEEIVHCIPSDRILKEGDILSLDLGIFHKGFCLDSALTIPIGKISDEAINLLKVTKGALSEAIKAVKPGRNIGIIGCTVQKYVEKRNLSVVRDLVGHGTGRKVHEEPQIPNFGSCGAGIEIKKGMVLAIEPMVTVGSYKITRATDGYGFSTYDGLLSAHFEHTILVGERGAEILT